MVMASFFRTSDDLIKEVLAILGVLSAGQPVDPEDYSYVQTKLDPIRRELGTLEICAVNNIDQIPGDWFSPLADVVAGECATKFGATTEDYVRLKNNGLGGAGSVKIGAGTGAMALKQMARSRYTGQVLQSEYF